MIKSNRAAFVSALLLVPSMTFTQSTQSLPLPASCNGVQVVDRSFDGVIPVAPQIAAGAAVSSTTVQTPEVYGASHSTATLSGCTTTASSNRVTCPCGIGDFLVGNGVRIPLAGLASPLSTMAAPALTVNGTAGSTTYTYSFCTADPMGGISGCSTATTTTGNATLSLADSISMTGPAFAANAELILVYRQIGAGAPQFITVANAWPFYDIGWTPVSSDGWPATPPTSQNQDFFSYIVAISGNTITLNDNVQTSLAGTAIVNHDDTLASRIALSNCAGGIVQFGPGTYPINQSSFWDYTNKQFWYAFTSSTGAYPYLYGEGRLQVPSGCTVQGAGKGMTFLQSARMTNPSAQNNTFGFSTGQHQNPFDWSVTPSSCAISNASVGASSVTATTPSCAANFAAGDYAMIAGGASVARRYYSNEITPVVSANATTGVIRFLDPLQKPVPLGTPGLAPTIYKITAETIHDVTIRDLTIQNYSGAFTSASVVYGASLSNIACPYLGNSEFWYANYLRHVNCASCDLTGGHEISLSEDIAFSDGTWLTQQEGIFASEASSNVSFVNETITMNEWVCQSSGSICTPSSGDSGLGAQADVSNFHVLNSKVTCNTALSNAVEAGVGCVNVQGGVISGYTPEGDSAVGNTIITTGHYGVTFNNSVDGSRVDTNRIIFNNAAENPLVGVQVASGSVDGNTIVVNSPTHAGDGYPVLVLNPVAPFQKIDAMGNTIDVEAGGNTHVGIQIADPGSVDTLPITIGNDNILNALTPIQVVNPTDTPNVQPPNASCRTLPATPITMSGGTGTFSNTCVLASSKCWGNDITNPAHSVIMDAPIAGSVSFTGTATDKVAVGCE